MPPGLRSKKSNAPPRGVFVLVLVCTRAFVHSYNRSFVADLFLHESAYHHGDHQGYQKGGCVVLLVPIPE
eukprot:1548654-Rhodomonas_salina.1